MSTHSHNSLQSTRTSRVRSIKHMYLARDSEVRAGRGAPGDSNANISHTARAGTCESGPGAKDTAAERPLTKHTGTRIGTVPQEIPLHKRPTSSMRADTSARYPKRSLYHNVHTEHALRMRQSPQPILRVQLRTTHPYPHQH
eukprot:6148554-Prymnesium_polylepis.2